MNDEMILMLQAEAAKVHAQIEPAEKRYTDADNAEFVAREELHHVRLRFERLSRAINVLEGKA